MQSWDGIASLLIACIEFILLLNLIIFSEKNRLNIISILIIFLLMSYQIFEFLMCQLNLDYSIVAYFAFVDISFLPPLNLILVLGLLNINNKSNYLLFLPAVAFTIYYGFIMEQFEVTTCTVLYASYNYPLGTLYGAFYYLPVLISILLLIFLLNKEENVVKLKSIKILLVGLIFISLPVIASFIFAALGNDNLVEINESVMCKFAVVYTFCLGYFSLMNKNKK